MTSSQNNNTKQNNGNSCNVTNIGVADKGGDDEEQVLENVGLNHTRHKLVPDGNDFKLVFISSDSSKESDNLNSSMEGANSPDALNTTSTTSANVVENQNYLINHQNKKTSYSI